MALNRFRDSSSAFRLLMAVGIAFLLSVALLVSNLDGRRNNFPDIPQYSPLPTVVRESVYTPRSEIVSRLKKILEISAAFHVGHCAQPWRLGVLAMAGSPPR